MFTEEQEEVSRLAKVQSILSGMDEQGAHLASELSRFISSISKCESYDDEYMLDLMSKIVRYLIPKADNAEIATSLLDLTRLHAGVGELIREIGIPGYLGRVAAQNPSDYTACNKVFVNDLIYNFYLAESIKCLETNGIKAVVRYLTEEPKLNTEEGKYHIRSIIHYLIDFGFNKISDEELSYLYSELGGDPVVKNMLDRYSKDRLGK